MAPQQRGGIATFYPEALPDGQFVLNGYKYATNKQTNSAGKVTREM